MVPAVAHRIDLWAPVAGQFLAAIPACMAAFTAWMSYRSSLANRRELIKTNEQVAYVADKVEIIHVATNSLKDQLVAATAAASHAQGMADATLAAKSEADAKAVAHAEGRAEAEAARLPPQAVPSSEGPVTVTGSPVTVTGGQKEE